MTILQAIILGIIQGITEFLPISSSAHLVLIPYLVGWELDADFVFPFDVLIQLGMLTALIFYYRTDLLEIFRSVLIGIKNKNPIEDEAARIGWFTLLATVPAGLAGLLIKDRVEDAFNNPYLTAILLFVTSGLLFIAEFAGRKNRSLNELRPLDALWIGIFQAFSIFPGISRSGSTIAGGMTRNFDRRSSSQFAFLMAIPALLAAGLLEILDLLKLPNLSAYLPMMAIGFLTSVIVGYFAIRWLINYLSAHSLLPFAVYCLIFGAGALLLLGLPAPAQSTADLRMNLSINTDIDVYKIAYEPDVEWLLPAMNYCQHEMDGLKFHYMRRAADSPPENYDLFILYGEANSLSGMVYQIGVDKMNLVAHPSSPLQTATLDLTAGLFSGSITTWAEALALCPECFVIPPSDEQIGLFIFQLDSMLGRSSLALFPPGFNFYSSATLTPGARQMREAIASNPAALGFLPGYWLDSSVREIPILDITTMPQAPLPILAYAVNNFDESLAQWLICVQNRIT